MTYEQIHDLPTPQFWQTYQGLSAHDKKWVKKYVDYSMLLNSDVARSLLTNKPEVDDEQYDLWVDLCEKALLCADEFQESLACISLMTVIMMYKGYFLDMDSNEDVFYMYSDCVMGGIGQELKWLNENIDHPDWRARMNCVLDCVGALSETRRRYFAWAEDMDCDEDTIAVDAFYHSKYYLVVLRWLKKLEEKRMASRPVLKDSGERVELGDPVQLFCRLNSLDQASRNHIALDAQSNVLLSVKILSEYTGKLLSDENTDMWVDDAEIALITADKPENNYAVPSMMWCVLEYDPKDGLHGSLGERIRRHRQQAEDLPYADENHAGGYGLMALTFAVLGALILFHPGLNALFAGDFFYNGSIYVAALIGIIVGFFVISEAGFILGIAACLGVATAIVFVSMKIEAWIGFGIAVKWLLFLGMLYGVFHGLGGVMTVNETRGHMKTEEFKERVRSIRGNLDIYEQYVRRCFDGVQKLENSIDSAFWSADKELVAGMRQRLPVVYDYYRSVFSEIKSIRSSLPDVDE